MSLLYIASPYSHPDPDVREMRYQQAMDYTARLLQSRKHAFSPIVHCHPLALQYKLPTDAKWWQEYNEEMLRKCSELHVLCFMEGWQASLGVTAEMKYATQHRIPIILINEL